MAFKTVEGDLLWQKIEKEFKEKIPSHIKFIFKLQGIDNINYLGRLNESHLIRIEKIVRSKAYDEEIPSNLSLSYCYGCYSASEFHFSVKDLQLIWKIQKLISKKKKNFES